MRKISITLLFIIAFAIQSFAQGFFDHIVKAGESVASIVQKYEVSPYEIYELNPDAKQGLNPGMVLVFLKNSSYPFDAKLIDIKKYKVAKGETLISIAKVNNIDVPTLKKYNPKFYAEEVKKGCKLKIPVFSTTISDASGVDVVEEVVVATTTNDVSHQVKAKETKYGIAKQYGLTIGELEDLNPQIIEGLKEGQVLKISKLEQVVVVTKNEQVIDHEYDYYTVKAKEGFYRLTKKLDVSKEELIALNPSLNDGIQLGMLLKYPKRTNKPIEKASYDLKDSITNQNTQHISYILPLRMHKYTKNDSTFNLKKLVKRDRVMNIALDFYSGAQLAIDSLTQLGVDTKVRILDSEYDRSDRKASDRQIAKLVAAEFQENEIVIGPIVPSNVKATTTGLNAKNIMVFAPFNLKIAYKSSNLVQTSPSVQLQREKMITYLEHDVVDKNVIIIADTTANKIKNILTSKFKDAKYVVPREDKNGLIIPKDFNNILDDNKENVVIIETQNMGLVATAVSILDTKLSKYKIKVVTTSSQKQFDNKGIANRYKTKLNYHYPSVHKVKAFEDGDRFIQKYKDAYGQLPNRYALRGFDLTFDTVLRQANKENITLALSQIGETSYTQNKFNYKQNTTEGYTNEAVYILRYTPEFTIEEVLVEVNEEIKEEKSNLVAPQNIVPDLHKK